MRRLRGPDGCPWDREQTWATLRRYLVEESYEAVDAIDRNDAAALREELGDLLLQVVFLAGIAEEEGRFDIDDVAHGIAEKLVRRHPHVFGSAEAKTAQDVTRNWEAIKRQEGKGIAGASRLDGIPAALPPLAKAVLLGERAAASGFDWPSVEGVWAKLDEELDELRAAAGAGDRAAVGEELGDLLFSVVNLARKSGVDPEAALEATNRKFRQRFDRVERELARRGMTPEEAGLETMDRLWDEAKVPD
jgi:MazG family protein